MDEGVFCYVLYFMKLFLLHLSFLINHSGIRRWNDIVVITEYCLESDLTNGFLIDFSHVIKNLES